MAEAKARPALVIEVTSPSTRYHDLNTKVFLYHRAGVPFEAVVFPRNAEVLAAAKSGSVDMVFTNATPARANDLDFSPTVLQVELGYLVPAGSKLQTIADVDQAGVRIAVTARSAYDLWLERNIKHAELIRANSGPAAQSSPWSRARHARLLSAHAVPLLSPIFLRSARLSSKKARVTAKSDSFQASSPRSWSAQAIPQ